MVSGSLVTIDRQEQMVYEGILPPARRGLCFEAATIAGVYEPFVRTAGTASGKLARGNLLQILTPATISKTRTMTSATPKPIDDCDP
jgi:hypothetical protein